MGNSFGNYGNGYGYGYGGGFGDGSGFDPFMGSNNTEMLEGVLGAVLGVLLVVALVILAVGVVTYILQSLALYTIAKRRAIKNPWLAWLPVGSEWILGSISDQYQYVAKGKIRNRRKVLLGLTIASAALTTIYEIMNTFQVFRVIGEGLSVGWGIMAVMMLLIGLGMIGVGVAMVVFYYIALYDLYQSCDPSNGILYLLLSIFLGVTTPFILFVCRKLDRGMPPRKEMVQTLPEESVEVVAEPVTEQQVAVVPEETESVQVPTTEETTPEE